MVSNRKLEAGISLSSNGMVIKGKPREVKAMLNDLVDTHGEDATLPDVWRNTMDAILHPVVPMSESIED